MSMPGWRHRYLAPVSLYRFVEKFLKQKLDVGVYISLQKLLSIREKKN